METENILNVCKFHSTDCKGRIRIITENIDIPVTMKEIVLVGMKLCQTHYNRYVINETHNLGYNKSCSHPKHELYKTQSKGNKQSKKLNLEKVPKRLIEVLGLDEFAEICSMCRKKTDKDPEYLQTEEYKAPISKKKQNDDKILQVGNYSYILRNDVFYSGEELKQLELDFQEILEHMTIPNEVSLSDKIIKMSNILYHNQHKLNQKPIYEPTTFKIMLEAADKDLVGFFDELYIGTNPHTKSDKTNENNKKKLVSLCYFLASINNKYINSIKADIGSYLQTSGASSSSIDTLANIGFSIRRMTVDRQKNLISNEHQQTVDIYCLQNIEKIFILNIDDYHNIHRRNKPTLLETHNIFHFVTILLNSNSNIAAIPYCSNNILIHNPKGIDFKLIIKNFEDFFMKQIDSYENRVENLNVHDYDGRIQNYQELRSLNNSKLVDFILHSLHSTKDYIECLDILFKVFERSENEYNYLDNYVIPVVADWPGQVNIRRAITLRINKGNKSGISEQILSLIPIIGPLHISLNSRETLFQTYHFFFEKLYHDLFGEKKILSHKPKQTIRNVVMHRFGNSKDMEYRMMIDLLDNSIPLTLDIYTILFRSGYFEGYLEGVVRIWVLFQRLRRHNYNKAPLMFLSDVFYWKLNNHPMANILKNHLPIFNDYFVENFHSSIRSQTAESNTALQIIQKAKIFDVEKNSNLSFKEAFVNSRNPVISQYPSFALPTFKINVDIKALPLAWNTKSKPSDDKDKFCDAEKCLLSNNNNIDLPNNNVILICGHGFHKECLTLYNGNCNHCFNYLSSEIKKNINSLTERLNTPLKDNEKPLIEKDANNNINEDIDENIQDIMENVEQNIDNQFEILYQKWSDYDNLY
ncbi:hypothetical protein RirG_100420 [Rhizophagus irregularis DAOM 197198w]|uniref:RING-type domain-containing protein n=2 Tax=Rhizophagus irregularis TaxID=588596 RepID=A0A015L8T3_RHIIW|nr:hypothetical protein RirG_100420 [Rhizophagus irregularis DAOM 197198w]